MGGSIAQRPENGKARACIKSKKDLCKNRVKSPEFLPVFRKKDDHFLRNMIE
jgi:hypothetical protein